MNDNNNHPMNDSFRNNFSIRTRILLGFGLVVLLFILSSYVTLHYLSRVKSDADQFISIDMPVNHSLIDLHARAFELEIFMQNLILLHDASMLKNINKNMAEMKTLIGQVNNNMAPLDEPKAAVKWDRLHDLLNKYLSVVDEAISLQETNQSDKVLELYKNKLLPLAVAMNDAFNIELSMENQDSGVLDVMGGVLISDMSDINNQIYSIYLSIIIFVCITVLVSFVIAIVTSRSILRPVKYAISIADKVASGERQIDIVADRGDETGLLLKSLKIMRDSIKQSEEKIQKSAEENKRLYESVVKAVNLFSQQSGRVSAGDLTKRLDMNANDIHQEILIKLGNDLNQMTDNIASVANDIMSACTTMVSTLDEVRHAVDAQSSGASEQASSINQITASITEIEKSATQTMNKAKDLGSIAEKTRQSGRRGVESIDASVQGMKSVKDKVQLIAQTILDLSRQTQQVGEITSVVNNLAQQSKMLALNASIEAAKAGDAGKGFAVVASEVKNLAEQSEQSTAQVQRILEDIKIATEKAVMVTEEGTKGVDSGLQMIERTGDIIRDLNDVIRETSLATQQIEAAVRQETAGIEQITAGMSEINIVTAAFVDSVSQTTQAMDDLAKVTNKLKSSVEIYKV